MTELNCGSCTACCRGEAVVLDPQAGDDPDRYLTQTLTRSDGVKVAALAHKPNGDCFYLGERGCSIYEDRPAMCRVFDCRGFALRFAALNRGDRRKVAKRQRGAAEMVAIGKAKLAECPLG